MQQWIRCGEQYFVFVERYGVCCVWDMKEWVFEGILWF